VRAAVVEVAGEPRALRLSRVERIVKLDPAAIESVQGRRQFALDGGSVGVVDAATVFGLAEPAASEGTVTTVVVGSALERYGLVVDRLLGEEDLVVRPLDGRLGKVPHVSAAAMLERGDPVLIVDVEDLVASLRQMLSEGRVLGAALRTSQSGPARQRVLVVDDSATVREVERQLLSRAGYDVDTAIDGVDGWNALSAGRYDLLVSDVDMPRMNGIELVRRLRADARFASLPVVIVSYKDREEDRLRGLEAGATAYLTKGAFQDESFVRMVHDLIGDGAE
ncbi:MAG: response regulator, partial [Phycisphaerales bacterium]|nr:response regulator [Phycisphaerales bacterium]